MVKNEQVRLKGKATKTLVFRPTNKKIIFIIIYKLKDLICKQKGSYIKICCKPHIFLRILGLALEMNHTGLPLQGCTWA